MPQGFGNIRKGYDLFWIIACFGDTHINRNITMNKCILSLKFS